jgi:hypothetical protein
MKIRGCGVVNKKHTISTCMKVITCLKQADKLNILLIR